MRFVCCVHNCTSSSESIKNDDVSFFKFPTEVDTNVQLNKLSLERQTAWIQAIKCHHYTNDSLKYKRVCSKHFILGQSADLRDYLNPDWVPSQNLGYDMNGKRNTVPNSFNLLVRKRRRKPIQNTESLNCDENMSDVEELISDPLAICTPIYDDPSTSKRPRLTISPNNRNPEQIDEIINLDDDTDEEHTAAPSDLNKNFNLIVEPESKAGIIAKLKEEHQQLKNDLDKALEHGKMSLEILKKDNNITVEYLTGFPSYEILEDLFQLVKNELPQRLNAKEPLFKFDAFMITLIKLKLDVPLSYLAIQYKASLDSITNLFINTIIVLHKRLRRFVYWPKVRASIENAPISFKRIFGRRRIFIIDCLEVFSERAENYVSRPNDQRYQTVKYLIGVSPSGYISYISKGFGICCTDRFVVEHCGFLEMIKSDDVILAESRLLIDSKTDEQATTIVPAFKNDSSQLVPITVQDSVNLANALADIRRIIGELRYKFSILANRQSTPRTKATEIFSEYIIKVICAIINLSQV